MIPSAAHLRETSAPRERPGGFLGVAFVVVAFCVPLFLGLGKSDLVGDEAIYSYAVDSIIQTGDWMNPLSSPHSDEVFLEKPPLKFWLVATTIVAGIAPHNEYGFRLWDALLGSVAFIYWTHGSRSGATSWISKCIRS